MRSKTAMKAKYNGGGEGNTADAGIARPRGAMAHARFVAGALVQAQIGAIQLQRRYQALSPFVEKPLVRTTVNPP